MKWYALNKEYVSFLKQFDSNVPNIEYTGKMKCFLGIVLETQSGYNYFAPMTSYKPKFVKMKNDVDFYKIIDRNSLIRLLNNMIPVPKDVCHEITLDNLENFRKFDNQRQKKSYWKFLQKELSFVDQNIIANNAEKLYRMVTLNPNGYLAKRCCNFQLLEDKAYEYEKMLSQKNKKKKNIRERINRINQKVVKQKSRIKKEKTR